jgi:hypothetical protein
VLWKGSRTGWVQGQEKGTYKGRDKGVLKPMKKAPCSSRSLEAD